MNELRYERIDKGIPRGTRRKAQERSTPADLGSWVIPADLKPQEVLERYLAAETTSQIAREYGLSRKALTKWLRESLPNEWKQVQVIRALCRKDDGDEGIERACDALSLARAREQLKSGQWDLERLDAGNYGQKQEVTHKIDPVDLGTVLAEGALQLLERLKTAQLEHKPVTPEAQVLDTQDSLVDTESTK